MDLLLANNCQAATRYAEDAGWCCIRRSEAAYLDDMARYGVSFHRLLSGERIDPREVYEVPT